MKKEEVPDKEYQHYFFFYCLMLLYPELADQPVQCLCLIGQFVGDRGAFFGGVRICFCYPGNFPNPVLNGNNHL